MTFVKVGDQGRKPNGRYKKKERDMFLLWGEHPKGWAMVKDLMLCLFLVNSMIGYAKQIDISTIVAPDVQEYANPVLIAPAQARETVEEVKAPQKSKIDVSEVVAKVYRLESSGGKNDSCRAKGLYNGYGYGWYDGKRPCFDSHEEVKKLVTEWFEKQLASKSLPVALCGYNRGFDGEEHGKCLAQDPEYPYYSNYLKL